MPQMTRELQSSSGNSKNNERPSEALKCSGNIHRHRLKLTPQFEPRTLHTIRVVTSKLSGVRASIGERSFCRQSSDILAGQIRKLMRRDMLLKIRRKVPAPPVHDQPTLLNELCLVNVGSSNAVALSMTHLPFDGRLRPQT